MILLALLLPLIPACPADGPVTSPYGRRTHPVTGVRSTHHGIDIGAPEASPIRAAWSGVVASVGSSPGWGNSVVVQTGPYAVRYAHASRVLVHEGDVIELGTQIGTVGATGRVTGPHLHLEVRRGRRYIRPGFLLGMCHAARVR